MEYKRIGAYLIDYFFISVLVIMFSQIKVINPYYDKYLDNYEVYQDVMDNTNVDNVSDIYKNQDYLISYQNVIKYGSFVSVMSMICYLLYFVGFQKWNKDQSLGKKIFGLKVVDKEEKSPSIYRYVLRTIFLYNLFVTILIIVLAFILSSKVFLISSIAINIIGYMFLYSNFLVFIFRKDSRAIHDIIAGTKVVEVENGNR